MAVVCVDGAAEVAGAIATDAAAADAAAALGGSAGGDAVRGESLADIAGVSTPEADSEMAAIASECSGVDAAATLAATITRLLLAVELTSVNGAELATDERDSALAARCDVDVCFTSGDNRRRRVAAVGEPGSLAASAAFAFGEYPSGRVRATEKVVPTPT